MSEIGLFDAMYTARALRRLKRGPSPEELITRVLRCGYPGSIGMANAQNWYSLLSARRRLASSV